MKKEYICYCGLYCEACAVKSKVEPAAKILHEEIKKPDLKILYIYCPMGKAFGAF